jgi:hypothetical protein
VEVREPEVGDIVRTERFGYHHVGVYIGPSPDARCIVHNDRLGEVVFSTWEEFAGGHEVHVHRTGTRSAVEKLAVANRARELVGEKFDLLRFDLTGPQVLADGQPLQAATNQNE